jgi:hypothetical protein
VPAGSSFAAAARHQRTAATPAHLSRTRQSWRSRLAAAAAVAIPPAPGDPVDRGVLTLELTPDRVGALRRECERLRCTAVHRVLGAFVSALAARTGRRDLVLWTTIDGRSSAQHDVVGMFASLCPVPVTAAGADPQAVLAEVRSQLLTALRYRQITAVQRRELMREAGVQPGAPVDLFVNIRQFDTGHAPARRVAEGLSITTDEPAMRGVSLVNAAALQLRIDEHRDRIMLTLINDGRRAPLSTARSVLDDLGRELPAAQPALS